VKTDRLDVVRAACAALGLRPAYLGEIETAIVIVDGVKVAATDAPSPTFLDGPGFVEAPRRPSVSRVFAELHADCLGSIRR
jgi:hypothetical protein